MRIIEAIYNIIFIKVSFPNRDKSLFFYIFICLVRMNNPLIESTPKFIFKITIFL